MYYSLTAVSMKLCTNIIAPFDCSLRDDCKNAVMFFTVACGQISDKDWYGHDDRTMQTYADWDESAQYHQDWDADSYEGVGNALDARPHDRCIELHDRS